MTNPADHPIFKDMPNTQARLRADLLHAGTAVVIIAGRYVNQTGVVAEEVDDNARTLDVLIGSPGHLGERVTVKRSSVEVYS